MLEPIKSRIMLIPFVYSISCYVLSQSQEFRMMLSLAMLQVKSHLQSLSIVIDHIPYANFFSRISFMLRIHGLGVSLHLDTSLMVPVVLHHGYVPI